LTGAGNKEVVVVIIVSIVTVFNLLLLVYDVKVGSRN
jgi:hypothetical protein